MTETIKTVAPQFPVGVPLTQVQEIIAEKDEKAKKPPWFFDTANTTPSIWSFCDVEFPPVYDSLFKVDPNAEVKGEALDAGRDGDASKLLPEIVWRRPWEFLRFEL